MDSDAAWWCTSCNCDGFALLMTRLWSTCEELDELALSTSMFTGAESMAGEAVLELDVYLPHVVDITTPITSKSINGSTSIIVVVSDEECPLCISPALAVDVNSVEAIVNFHNELAFDGFKVQLFLQFIRENAIVSSDLLE